MRMRLFPPFPPSILSTLHPASPARLPSAASQILAPFSLLAALARATIVNFWSFDIANSCTLHLTFSITTRLYDLYFSDEGPQRY